MSPGATIFRAVDLVSGKEVYTLPLHAYMGASLVIRDGQYTWRTSTRIIGIDSKANSTLDLSSPGPKFSLLFLRSGNQRQGGCRRTGQDTALPEPVHREGSLDLYHARRIESSPLSPAIESTSDPTMGISTSSTGIGQKNPGFHGREPRSRLRRQPPAVSW